MTPKTKTLISTTIILATALLLLYYLYNHLSDFKSLFSLALKPANLFLIILIVFILIINLLLNGLLLDILMRPFRLKLSKKEIIGLSVITNFYNYITPFHGGMAARAIYLKKEHKFPYVHFLATLSAIYVIIFLIGSLAGLVSMLFI